MGIWIFGIGIREIWVIKQPLGETGKRGNGDLLRFTSKSVR
jgi:hypothetical protein